MINLITPFSIILIIFANTACVSSLQAEKTKKSKPERVTLNLTKKSSVILPKNYRQSPPKVLSFPEQEYTLKLYSREFAQGDIIYAELLPPEGKSVENFRSALFFNNKQIPLTDHSWGKRGFIGLHPLGATGKKSVKVGYRVDGKYRVRIYRITINPTKLPVSRTVLQLGKYSNQKTYSDPEVIKKIQYSTARKKEVYAKSGENMIAATLSHPRDMHHVTSAYYTKRIKEQYTFKKGKRVNLKPMIRYHRGLDLRGLTGEPVFAMARGKVVLAEELYFEGNFILLDHGNNIMSAYMHLNSINVKEGDIVEAGQRIAAVGASGAVTGAHLHVSFYINGMSLDPMSLLVLPVRD